MSVRLGFAGIAVATAVASVAVMVACRAVTASVCRCVAFVHGSRGYEGVKYHFPDLA